MLRARAMHAEVILQSAMEAPRDHAVPFLFPWDSSPVAYLRSGRGWQMESVEVHPPRHYGRCT